MVTLTDIEVHHITWLAIKLELLIELEIANNMETTLRKWWSLTMDHSISICQRTASRKGVTTQELTIPKTQIIRA